MASTSNGLLEWGNNIRFSLANDAGRQLFQESVQEHGLVFLDDWFDNILLSGRQKESVIPKFICFLSAYAPPERLCWTS